MKFEMKSTCPTAETLIIRPENGIKRKEVIYFLLLEDVEVLQGKWKIEDRADKMEKVLYLWNGSSKMMHTRAMFSQDDQCYLGYERS